MVGLGGSPMQAWPFPTLDRLLAHDWQSATVPNRTVAVSVQCGRRSKSVAWLHHAMLSRSC
jgi:hypothetical protein